MENNIEKLQKKILDIYIQFDKVCKKYNLSYFAIGGTCIGAIRHKGFIPWDDDMDVAMPVEDYIKLREIAKKEFNKQYQLVDYMKSDDYIFNFMKLQDINTTLVEDYDINLPNNYRGIYIDIMPIVGIPKNKIISLLYRLRVYFLFKINKNIRSKYFLKTTFKGKLFWILLRPFTFFKEKNYYSKKIEKLFCKYKIEKNNNILFAWRIPLRKPYSNIFDYSDFQSYLLYDFENIKIRVPIGYDNYLKKDFGDYMKIPPKEKQITHIKSILDFEKPYSYYAEKKRKSQNEQSN